MTGQVPCSADTTRKLKKGWLKVTNFSQANGDPSVEVKTVFEGEGDPGYLNTCC